MSDDSSSPSAPPALDRDSARKLDGKIRRVADHAGKHLKGLASLVARAKAGSIHQALGFSSWSAYAADALKPLTRSMDHRETRQLVAQLWEQGMSIRGISEATGVARSTVGDQVSGSGHVGQADSTTGLDNKTYPRRRGGGGHRGPYTPDMRLNRAVKAIANIDLQAAEDPALLRLELEKTRELINEAIDHHLEAIAAHMPKDLDTEDAA